MAPAPVLAAGAAIVKQPIRTESFTGIALSGAIDVTITQANTISVVASGTDTALADLQVEVRNGTLRLSQKNRLRLGRREKAHVAITMPDLRAIDLSGSGNLTVSGMKLDRISFSVSGAGDLTASGTCNKLQAEVTGAGDINARNLKCRSVSARVSGVGDIEVHAEQSVSAQVSGAGDIEIYGNPPERSVRVAGLGDVSFRTSAQ